ncbi:hypothetical protein ACHAW5_011251 [Stephanodiscus triporus]|uniref:Uncharacterized protein n=1 Tax=Stephanodiscus triporus TaxID=2934178 RepID=A0ABD3PPU2_9STRA
MAARSDNPPPDGMMILSSARAAASGGGESYRRRPGPTSVVAESAAAAVPSSSSSTTKKTATTTTGDRRRRPSRTRIGRAVVPAVVVIFATSVALSISIVVSSLVASRGGGREGATTMAIRGGGGGGGGGRDDDDDARGGPGGKEEGSTTSSSSSRTTVLAAAAAGERIEKTTTTVDDKDGDGIDDPPRRRRGGRIVGAAMIPPVLVFTYHTDLLGTPASDLADDEDASLAANVRSIIELHRRPDDDGATTTTVRFLDDDDCIESIMAALGHDTNLTKYFRSETRGMYKADICRGAALYETGGLYFDVDVEARMSMYDAIDPRTEFVTTYVHVDSNHRGMFFQAFIGSTPRHPILRRYLELFVLYYEGEVDVGGPLGVYLLRMAYDDVVGEGGKKMKDDGTIDLWQEVRYRPELFPEVTRDHWGARRACQMLVVAPPSAGRKERMVPLFSHANGSRMCGGKDTNKKG